MDRGAYSERGSGAIGHRIGWFLLGSALALMVIAPAAQASFHLMKIREVFTSGASGSYVELQMYAAGQNFVGGHHITTYSATGVVVDNYSIPNDVTGTHAGDIQKTILFAGLGYSGPAADFTNSNLNLPPAAGAVCFDAIPNDCVSWGAFTGNSSLPSSAGSPASPGGVTAGKALRRSIAPSCPTFLEPGDDTNSSVADFSEQTPDPRPNADAVDEVECKAPNTTVDSATIPAGGKTNSTGISFTFSASPAEGASFECALDGAPFSSCSSPQEYASLNGDNSQTGTPHSFQVRAKNSSGTDSTPATHNWTVDIVAPAVILDSEPNNPSPGNSVSFTFHVNESASKFECSLDEGATTDSFSICPPANYSSLADGTYTFNVKATDQAGNTGAPTSYEWEVDNSLNDEEPPLTTIQSGPPDPSTNSTASFTYESNEPGSTFECALDAAGFTGCPASGVTYTGLANGPHTFQVRATDGFGNTDKSPAGYSWTVFVAPVVPTPIGLAHLPTPALPETTITGKPGAKTRDRTPTFRFKSNRTGLSFECKLDKAAFRACSSPFTTKTLAFGPHTFQVRALKKRLADPTPASASFKVLKPKKKGRR